MKTVDPDRLLSTLPWGIALLDAEGVVLQANAALERLLGRPAAELAGRDFFSELASLPGLADVRRLFRERIGEEALETAFETDLSPAGTAGGARARILLRSLRDRGTTYALVIVESSPEGAGRPKAAETLQETLRLVSEIRHDVTNPLMGLLGHLELLQARTDLSEAARRHVDTIAHEAGRVRERISRLDQIRKT